LFTVVVFYVFYRTRVDCCDEVKIRGVDGDRLQLIYCTAGLN